jgi:CheY-like chemotaxis protein
MPMIEEFVDRATPVSPQAPAVELLGCFEASPDLHLLPVIDQNRLVGVIERGALLMRLAATPATPMTAEQIMDPEPVVVDAGQDAAALCDILLAGGDVAVMRGFVVTRQGRYLGVGTPAGLLRALSRAPATTRMSDVAAPASASDDAAVLVSQIRDELRGPANTIIATLELLERQVSPGEVLEQLRAVGDQARELGDLLRDVSEFAQDAPALRPSPTPLRGLMDEIETRWSARTARNGVTLLVGYEGDTELSADLDAPRIHRLFDNLIGPALRFAREGMVEVRLKAHAIGHEVHLLAQVRDDATRPETADAVSLSSGGDVVAGGTFPLSVCRRLVSRLGGSLRAEHNAGCGSTLTFELHAPRSIPAEAATSNVETLVDLNLQAAPHILVVDDNATNRIVAQALCEMFGCSCETVEDGLEALEAVQSRPFDLILMDIKMPRMDGVQATRAIRALTGPERHTPIIALTANADPADAAGYIASGMAAVVEKPIKPERLRMAMNAALAAGAAADEDQAPAADLRSA